MWSFFCANIRAKCAELSVALDDLWSGWWAERRDHSFGGGFRGTNDTGLPSNQNLGWYVAKMRLHPLMQFFYTLCFQVMEALEGYTGVQQAMPSDASVQISFLNWQTWDHFSNTPGSAWRTPPYPKRRKMSTIEGARQRFHFIKYSWKTHSTQYFWQHSHYEYLWDSCLLQHFCVKLVEDQKKIQVGAWDNVLLFARQFC